MNESCVEAKVKADDFLQLTADGASNAVGSVQEFELLTREEGRSNSVNFNVCLSHQNERSSGYASGTTDFASKPNDELGAVLKKSHSIQVRINRAPKRMEAYRSVQESKGRNPPLHPNPCNETRWQGVYCILLSHIVCAHPHLAMRPFIYPFIT